MKTDSISHFYFKRILKRIQKGGEPYTIRTIFKSSLTLHRNISCVKPNTEDNIKNCAYFISWTCDKDYSGEISCPLKVRLEEHWKVIRYKDLLGRLRREIIITLLEPLIKKNILFNKYYSINIWREPVVSRIQ